MREAGDVLRGIMTMLRYLKARLGESSTWLAIGVGITGAAALTAPWSYAFAFCGVIGALVPTTKAPS